MAEHRHKRDTNARRTPRATTVAGSLAVLATAGAVSIGVLASTGAVPVAASPDDRAVDSAASFAPGTETPSAGPTTGGLPVDGPSIAARELVAARRTLSRSANRDDLTAIEKMMRPSRVAKALRAADRADEQRYTTAVLNLWTQPGDDAVQKGELASGKKVSLTGRSLLGRDEIVFGQDQTRWVTSGYFSKDKPLGLGAGITDAPCPSSSPEYRLTANAVLVYRSVCHAFPQISSYGGWDAHGEHASGRAIDIMTSDPALLTAIADFLRAHADELHLYDIIRMQHIWTPVRAAEGWRLMPDRGSATANHYDHVHVAVY